MLAQLIGDEPGNQVGAAAGWKADLDADRFVRVVLRNRGRSIQEYAARQQQDLYPLHSITWANVHRVGKDGLDGGIANLLILMRGHAGHPH